MINLDKEQAADKLEDRYQDPETGPLRRNPIVAALKETLTLLVMAIVLAWFIYTFVIQTFWIPSGSMEPTIMPGDRVLVAKFYYHFTDLKPGDIFVFPSPETIDGGSPDLIKRIVATPGMVVREVNGKLYINDRLVKEPYTLPDQPGASYGPYRVPKNKLFAMGDNRGNSKDSRWIGPIDRSKVVGRAFFTYWPLNRIGILK